MLLDYIKYFFKATNSHGLHSPFIFDFYNSVFNQTSIDSDLSAIEILRTELKKDKTLLSITDFGAGSKYTLNNQRSIASISKYSSKKAIWGRFLNRLIKKYNYTHIIDLGTSLGLTTAYMAKANSNAQVVTFEGCSETLEIAKKNCKLLNINNIKFINGNIDNTLPLYLNTIENVDLIFFDANHQFAPTIEYFEECLKKVNMNSCFVFDDIYWSSEMKKAWQTIKNNQQVTVSIDLFYIGVVFFKKELKKQNFVLK